MKRLIAAFAALCLSAFAQTGTPVNQAAGLPSNSAVMLYYYSGTSKPIYICSAPAQVAPTTYTIGATPGFTQIVVTTNSAVITFSAPAQLWIGQRITVAGMVTTALNGTYKITAVSGSTATFTSSGVANATYNTSGATITTTGPILSASTWSIQAFAYDGSDNLISSYTAGAGIAPPSLACSARASY